VLAAETTNREYGKDSNRVDVRPCLRRIFGGVPSVGLRVVGLYRNVNRRRGFRWTVGRTRPASLAVTVMSAVLVGCTEPSSQSPREAEVITVGSFDFAESAVLAEVYVAALRDAGAPVEHVARVGTRETMLPALQKGLIDVVPEYAGSALEFVGGDATADPAATHDALQDALAPRGIEALEPAPAQNRNGLVVTEEMASQHGLRRISDLTSVAADMTLGGPPECPERPLCLPGFREVYGLSFGDFMPLDTGGPVTAEAVSRGIVDVGVLFTADPSLDQHGLVLLIDDRGLQPAENVTPLVRMDALRRFGAPAVDALEAVSSALTTDDLRAMTARVLSGSAPAEVAKDWLVQNGLITQVTE
jgi:osmoprotectant transport system substrate-binding protein